MTIIEKLTEFNLFDNVIIRHGICENIRDYEIIGYIIGVNFNVAVQYIFKGCIEANFKNTVTPESFSMDNRLLDLSRQDEPDYPQKFIWDVGGANAYPGWKLEENTEELKKIDAIYQLKFYKFIVETNAYRLNLVFHDLEVRQLKQHDKLTS